MVSGITSSNIKTHKFPPLEILRDLGLDPSPREKIKENSSGVLHVPVPKFSGLHLSKENFETLDDLTIRANAFIDRKAAELQAQFDRSSVDLDNAAKTKLENDLKMHLRKYFEEIFETHFDIYSEKHISKTPSKSDAKNYDFLSHPMFQVAVKDSKIGDFSRTRAVFDQLDTNFIFSVFKIPFIKGMNVPVIGWQSIDKMFLEKFLLEGSKSRVSKASSSSAGLNNPNLVGLFPEAHVGEVDQNSFTVYKADFFYNRFKNFTTKLLNPLIDTGKNIFTGLTGALGNLLTSAQVSSSNALSNISRVAQNTFATLKDVIPSDIFSASSFWLTRHEDLHRTGDIPRVNSDAEIALPGTEKKNPRTIKDVGYFLKDYFESAAFEEMRVDIQALIDFADKDKFKDKIQHRLINVIRDFVLSERMLRYATQNDVNDVFDAVVSQVLINWFVAEGVVDRDQLYKNHVMEIKNPEKINTALIKFRDTINSLEKDIESSLIAAEANPGTGLKLLLENKSLDDKAFKKELVKLDVFKASRDKIFDFMRKWGNWHIDDIAEYKDQTQGAVDAFQTIWAPGLTKLAEPQRLKSDTDRKRPDQYTRVHPYISSLRNSKYYLDNKNSIDPKLLAS